MQKLSITATLGVFPSLLLAGTGENKDRLFFKAYIKMLFFFKKISLLQIGNGY